MPTAMATATTGGTSTRTQLEYGRLLFLAIQPWSAQHAYTIRGLTALCKNHKCYAKPMRKRSKIKLSFIILAAVVLLTSAAGAAALVVAHNSQAFLAVDPDDNLPPFPDNVPATPVQVTSSPGCDPSLWGHVHQPSRLRIYDNCIQITGTVVATKVMGDGDMHILVR